MILILRFSAKPLETSNPVYDKVNRRLEHLSKLKTNTSKYESESMAVSANYVNGRLWVDVTELYPGELVAVLTMYVLINHLF